MNNKAYAVPLHELLAGVPRGARLEIYDPDGMGTRFIPVGRYCHEAAEILRAKLNKPEKEVMQMALDALNNFDKGNHGMRWQVPIIKALRARLAQPESAECDGGQCGIGGYCKQCPKTQPEQKPVAWKMKGVQAFATSRPNDTDSIKWDALYTASPQREWVGLTEKEILADDVLRYHFALNGGAGPISKNGMAVIAAVNAKLKEKNA